MELIGADADYIAEGKSYFTVESHLGYIVEVGAGERITVTTQVMAGQGKRLHLFHRLEKADGRLAATGEQMLIHVDLRTRRSSRPAPAVAERLARFVERHASLPSPDGVGRGIGRGS
jgi:carnitine 3-dehydrogenase